MSVSHLVFDFAGTNTGGFRNDIKVDMSAPGAPPDLSFDMATDEGAYMGGTETAAPPLAHFTTALAGCMMTQLREMASRMDIPLGNIGVTGRITWLAEMNGKGPYKAGAGGVELDVTLDTEAPVETQKALLAAAQHACFVEATILNGDTISHGLIVDGERITID